MDEKLHNINECLEIINDIASSYEKDIKVKYGVKDSYQGPTWYKYHHNLWFRGQPDYNWSLLPQVCRNQFQEAASKSQDTIVGYEKTAFNQFITRANHLIEKSISISEQYFIAQHYGLPTRLLDWTTNPLTALYFAVAEKNFKKNDGAFFVFLSRKDIPGFEHEDILYSHRDVEKIESLVKEVLYKKAESDFYEYPVRIIPNNQTGRIISQSSRFTLHLENSKEYSTSDSFIFKIRIPNDVKKNILRELSCPASMKLGQFR